MQRIRGPKSLIAGLVFIGLAVIFGTSASSLTLGTAARMGAGYFPMMIALVLGFLGVLTTAIGLFARDERPAGTSIRGVLLVGGSVLAFAVSIETLGLVIAVFTTSFMLSLAERNFRFLPSLATAAVLAGFSWAVFAYALSMPWPVVGYLLR
jgi:hypothetical protein